MCSRAIDRPQSAIAIGTKQLMPRLNLSYVARSRLELPAAQPYDFCFVDGDHSYSGVLRDYGSFAPSCGYMMFHDIQDTSTLHLKNFTGGTPMFWAHLAAYTAAARRAEFTHIPPGVPFPTFGLGVLGPNAKGNTELDVPIARWPTWIDWVSGDATAEPLHRALCAFNRTRLCALGAKGILDGQKAAKWVQLHGGRAEAAAHSHSHQ